MLITKRSPVTGQMNTLDLNVDLKQMNLFQNGIHIQNAMPHLTPDEREFLISGTLPNEWDLLFDDELDEKEKEPIYDEVADEWDEWESKFDYDDQLSNQE